MQRLEQLVAPLSAQLNSVRVEVKTEIQTLAGRAAMLEVEEDEDEDEEEDGNEGEENAGQEGHLVLDLLQDQKESAERT